MIKGNCRVEKNKLNKILDRVVHLVANLCIKLNFFFVLPIESGTDVSTRSRGGGGLDYYTLTYNYDDDDEKYEEDSIPGMGSGGSPSSGIVFLHFFADYSMTFNIILRKPNKI